MNIHTSPDMSAAFIDKHIRADVTALVALAAKGNTGGAFAGAKIRFDDALALVTLTEKALDLHTPFLDYEAAARAAGWEKAATGWHHPRNDDPQHDDEFRTVQEVCTYEELDVPEIPIIGHYIVTAELADKLEARGERVERDFGGVIVWARKFAANHDEAAMIHGWRYDSACGWYHPHDSADAPETYDTAKDICEDLGLAVAGLPLDRDPVLLAIIEAQV
jgi:hypothetical protein